MGEPEIFEDPLIGKGGRLDGAVGCWPGSWILGVCLDRYTEGWKDWGFEGCACENAAGGLCEREKERVDLPSSLSIKWNLPDESKIYKDKSAIMAKLMGISIFCWFLGKEIAFWMSKRELNHRKTLKTFAVWGLPVRWGSAPKKLDHPAAFYPKLTHESQRVSHVDSLFCGKRSDPRIWIPDGRMYTRWKNWILGIEDVRTNGGMVAKKKWSNQSKEFVEYNFFFCKSVPWEYCTYGWLQMRFR